MYYFILYYRAIRNKNKIFLWKKFQGALILENIPDIINHMRFLLVVMLKIDQLLLIKQDKDLSLGQFLYQIYLKILIQHESKIFLKMV